MTPYNSWCWEQRRAESPIRRITMTPYNSWCCEQRRAESPIRIQPRAAPWVKIFQQTCALKEQKEGERVSISLAPVALTARQLVNELTPRVLPWAVFPLGLRPAIARNHGSCTFRWIIFLFGFHPLLLVLWLLHVALGCVLLGLRPVLAYNIGCCTLRWVIFHFRTSPHHCPKLWLLQYTLFSLFVGCTVWHNRISCVFTTRPYRFVLFRCYDKNIRPLHRNRVWGWNKDIFVKRIKL